MRPWPMTPAGGARGPPGRWSDAKRACQAPPGLPDSYSKRNNAHCLNTRCKLSRVAEYRIDELARVADLSVRNIRVYQDRGLLAPPRRQGRVGIYTDAHLARLRLIGQLLRRGYTFANIAELLAAWERGGDVAEIFDFESAIGDPWSDEVPGYM